MTGIGLELLVDVEDGGRSWRAVKQRLPKSRLRQPVAPELLRRLPTRWRVKEGRLVPLE